MTGPEISVMLPTRGRTTSLETCVMSLVQRADNVGSFEILLAFDHDDTESLAWFQTNVIPQLDEHEVTYTLLGFDRLGYIRLNEYINALAAQAQGRWLFFWSDDAIMESSGWDTIIRSHDQFRLLRIPTHNSHPYAIFPIVPKQWYDLLGYVSPHQLTDSTVSQMSYMLDIVQNVDIQVIHDRADLTGNNDDDTFKNRPYLEGNPSHPADFNHPTWRERRVQDCRRLAEYLEDQGEDMTWFKNVMAGKQDPWAKMTGPIYDPNGQIARFK